MNNNVKKEVIKILESILTIDGQGRPVKARMLLELMSASPSEEFIKALKEVGGRK